jgi:hypothetical protein
MTISITEPFVPRDDKNYGSATVSELTKDDLSFIDEDFKWSNTEEAEVLDILDKNLMLFVLLMTFVLNMDRTNICMFFFFERYAYINKTFFRYLSFSKCNFR